MTLALWITLISATIYLLCNRRADILGDISDLAKYSFACGLIAYLFGH